MFNHTVMPKKAGLILRASTVLSVFALLVQGVFAVQDVRTQTNPYFAIIERNAFDLTDAPPLAKDTPPPEPPKNLDLKFTGIYRLKGVEKACLALIDSSVKPPETKYLQIPVGDKQGAIEITAIDAEAGTVNLIKTPSVPGWTRSRRSSPTSEGPSSRRTTAARKLSSRYATL